MCGLESHIDQIIEGDCLTYLPMLPDKCVDLILCDLPYGHTDNPWDECIDLMSLWTQYKRIVKQNGMIVLTSQGTFTGSLITTCKDWFKYKMVWIKAAATNFLNAKIQPLRKHEDICVFYPGKPLYNPQMWRGKRYDKGSTNPDQQSGSYGKLKERRIVNTTGWHYPNDVIFMEEYSHEDWVYFKGAVSEGVVYHPTQKPIALGRYLVRTFSNPGAVVLDNACGSGTFPLAALLEGRRFIGIELNKHAFRLKHHPVSFVQIAKERIERGRQLVAEEARKLRLF